MLEDQLTLWTGAVRRRLNWKKHERLAAEILESVEPGAIHAISAEPDTARGMSKFADFESWLTEAVRRFDRYKLQALPPGTRILQYLNTGARVVVKFNVDKMISSQYPPDVWRLVRDLVLFSVARFRDSWILRANGAGPGSHPC